MPDAGPSTTFHFGFRGGPEISRARIRFEDGREPELDLVLGLHFGFVVGWDAGPFGIRSGLNYVNAGALFNGTDFLARDEFNVSFITLPIDFRLRPVRRGAIQPYIFAGPEFRYSLDLEERPISLTHDLKLLDATFAAGVGISMRLPFLPIRFSPEIRYANDLTGIYNGEMQTDDGGIVETAESVKANALRVGVLLGI